jgi:hypothetical protein
MTPLEAGPQLAPPAASGAWHSFLLFVSAVGVALLIGMAAELFGPVLALGAPLAMAALAMALRDYRLACWLGVLMLPLAQSYLIPRDVVGLSGVNIMYLLLAVSVSAWFLAHAVRPHRFAFPLWPRPFWMYMAVFAAAAMHGAFYSATMPDYFVALELVTSSSPAIYLRTTFITPCVLLATAMIASVAVSNAKRPGLYLVPLLCSALVLALAVFYHVAYSHAALGDLAGPDSRAYLSGIGLHANELGLLLNMGWTLAAFSCLYASRPLLRLALAGAAAVLAGAVLMTFSRGAYLGALVVLVYLLFVQRRFILFALALLVLPLAALLMPDSVTQRATHEMHSNDVNAISSGRATDIWQPLLPDFAKSPLVGSGLGSILWSDAAKQRKILPVTHPHSAYVGALLDFGVLGTAIVFLFFWHMWRLFSRLGRALPDPLWRGFFRGAAACILLMLVQGVTDDNFMPTRSQPLLWLAYGFAVGFASRQQARGRTLRATTPELPPTAPVKAELT